MLHDPRSAPDPVRGMVPPAMPRKPTKKAPRKGRPPRSTEGAATVAVMFRVTAAEHAALLAAAGEKPLATFVRDLALSSTKTR